MSRYYYIPNLVSSNAAPLPGTPWKAKVSRPEFHTKDAFREWCRDANTRHAFLSMVEGLTPSLRVDKNNPPHRMHGLIVDYDAKVGEGLVEAAEKISRRVPVSGHSPSYIASTYSGGARLVWEFEKPLAVETPELAEATLKELSKKLALGNLLPGLDKTTLELNRYFEIGDQWTPIPGGGTPVSEDYVMSAVFAAAKKAKLVSSDTLIPIEDVAEAVEKFYPGRWPGHFEIGARGPLFWVADGVDRIGCQVAEHGMVCYSDRAGKAFMQWRDIFGHEFVKEYTERKIGDLAKRVWWDSKHYWVRGARGWAPFVREDFRLYAKGAGFSDRLVQGKTVTEVEEVLLFVHEHRRVEAAVPFVFQKKERIGYNGKEFLNTNRRFAMPHLDDPDKGDPANWPWLLKYFGSLFSSKETEEHPALDSFYAWLQHAYEGAVNNDPKAGHVVIIAGPPGRGKTLLSQFILGSIFGGFADASEFLLKGGFNKEMAEIGLWCVDDGTTTANFNDHKKFTEMLKRHVANPNVTYHPKFRDATMLPWKGRIVITCNLDADSLSVLPNLDTNILDKLMLFRMSDNSSDIRGLFNDYDIEATIRKELPYFLTWLAYWNPPENVIGGAESRYGVVPFHHEDLVEAAKEASPDHRFYEILDIFARSREGMERDSKHWEGSAADLLRELHRIDGMSPVLRSYTANSVGRILSKFVNLYPGSISVRSLKGYAIYKIEFKKIEPVAPTPLDPVMSLD